MNEGEAQALERKIQRITELCDCDHLGYYAGTIDSVPEALTMLLEHQVCLQKRLAKIK